MTVIASIDPTLRRIYLHADTVGASVHPLDIYQEERALRRTDESLRKFDNFMRMDGNITKGGGKFTERYATLLGGTRIVPFDTSHELTITGTIITDVGTEGIACFDRSSLNASTVVDINYVPPQVEVVTINTGSGLSIEQDAWLSEIYTGTDRTVHLDTGAAPGGDGSALTPFHTVALAVDYANLKGLSDIRIHSDMTLDRALEGFNVEGGTEHTVTVTGYSIEGTSFKGVTVAGTMTGTASFDSCNIADGFDDMSGGFANCYFLGDMTLANGATADFNDCLSGIAGLGRPTLDFVNDGNIKVSNRGYHGGITYKNMTAGDEVTHESAASAVILDSGCTGGTFVIRGNVNFVDNSVGTTVDTDGLVKGDRLSEIWQRLGLDPDNDLITNEDGSITVAGITITANTTGTTPNRQTTQDRT